LKTPSSIRIPEYIREIGDEALYWQRSLIDLSFDEGTVRIGVSAFSGCSSLEKTAFPASVIVIEANAFQDCRGFRQVTFAVGSQLQYIRSEAFSDCPLSEVVVPASIVEIDPFAFSDDVWQKSVRFEGPPLFLIDREFIRSLDSRVIFRYLSPQTGILIGANIEVIGANAFRPRKLSAVLFESDTKLREIGSGAFSGCRELKGFKVPESVEILGAHCFEDCSKMEIFEFELS
jgi:hypothetical protein